MSKYITVSPTEATDRLVTRGLVEAYAHCADRRKTTARCLSLPKTPTL